MLVIKPLLIEIYIPTSEMEDDDQPHVPWLISKVLQKTNAYPNICLISLPSRTTFSLTCH